MALDFTRMEREVFLQQYGHLRPGTYDILSPRYDEVPDRYFDWAAPRGAPAEPLEFALSLPQLNRTSALLRDHGIEHDAVGLFNFIKAAIEGREYSKFVFTRSLSDALVLLGQLGESCGLSVDDCAYIDIQCLHRLYASSDEVARELKRSVAEGRERYEATRQIMLPPLIVEPSDVWAFELSSGDPSFITLRSATGPVAFVGADTRLAKDSILLIPSADPGYDWIFAHGVAGFITMYGGANSHMAIRAGELGIPAVIGAGEVLFKRWSSAHVLQVDCANRQVRVVR
jgi:phosphohistidine swiveling domain-containing protein